MFDQFLYCKKTILNIKLLNIASSSIKNHVMSIRHKFCGQAAGNKTSRTTAAWPEVSEAKFLSKSDAYTHLKMNRRNPKIIQGRKGKSSSIHFNHFHFWVSSRSFSTKTHLVHVGCSAARVIKYWYWLTGSIATRTTPVHGCFQFFFKWYSPWTFSKWIVDCLVVFHQPIWKICERQNGFIFPK